MSALPSVAVVIPNLDGAHHLADCLDSLTRVDYPGDSVRVLVVDNGSTDDSAALVRGHALGADVLELGHNHGFAAAANAGARHVETECVAFLNNDMIVEPAWLQELVAAFDPSRGITCVGGMILDWTGDRVDFAGGVVNFHGFGDQPGFGDAAPDGGGPIRDAEPFACGGSMLIGRERFLEVGGFDESYFAYFEDVDLGWRLNVLGDRVAFAPSSRCYHRHHGTSRKLAGHQRTLLLERNALRSLFKNVDDANLGRLLAPASLLLVARVLDDLRSDRAEFEPFAAVGASTPMSAHALGRLHAVGDLLESLPELSRARAAIQRSRSCDDDAVFARFGELRSSIGSTSDEYDATFEALVHLFGIGDDRSEPAETTGDALPRLGASHGRLRDAVHRSGDGGWARLARRAARRFGR